MMNHMNVYDIVWGKDIKPGMIIQVVDWYLVFEIVEIVYDNGPGLIVTGLTTKGSIKELWLSENTKYGYIH